MHKKIKHIIAVSLIITAVSGVVPASKSILGLGATKTDASTHHFSDRDEEDYKEAYLEGIYLSDGEINFSKDQMSYVVNVGKDVKEITVKAKPGNDDDIIEINGTSIDGDDDNKFSKKVSLNEGKNVITIYIKSDDDDETYTLNVYRRDVATVANNTVKTTTGQQSFVVSDDQKTTNAWQRVDGKWKYADGTGQYLKNIWWFDKNTSKHYYLDKDGYRTIGWFSDNNNWYYFNENGEMQTGWISINKNWYFLNTSGAMKMGWLEDSSGNWYYLDNSGAMQTGWLENSDGKWYYLDTTGKMIKDSSINGYNLGKDGVLTN